MTRLLFVVGAGLWALLVIAAGCGDEFIAGETTGTGGSAEACTTESDCPGVDDACKQRLCSNGSCAFSFSAAAAECPQGVCDGEGECVECVDNAMCDVAGEVCAEGECVPAHCINDELDGDESDVDCGGSCPGCANGDTCNGPADCRSNVCVDDVCQPCVEHDQCPGGMYCDPTTQLCRNKRDNGEDCTGNAVCQSGHCPDGVCCDTACQELCVSCREGSTGQPNGSCKPVLADLDPDEECADEAASTCGTSGKCDGAGACKLHPAGVECASPQCQGDDLVTSACDGNGTCATDSDDCALFVCESNACVTSCSDSSDCDVVCDAASGQCLGCAANPPTASGAPCSPDCSNGCANGTCVIDCLTTGACATTTKNCADGMPCVVNCTSGACTSLQLNCPADHACTLDCEGTSACAGADLNCGAGSCSLSCNADSNACLNVDQNCGSNECEAVCGGTSQPVQHCGPSCMCTGC